MRNPLRFGRELLILLVAAYIGTFSACNSGSTPTPTPTPTQSSTSTPSPTPTATLNPADVTTQHNDLSRDGQNLYETTLTPSNVNSTTFGKIAALPVDGLVYAQPLTLSNVNVPGSGQHNLLFVATENDSVFAFDTSTLSTTPVWQRTFLGDASYACPNPPCTVPTVLEVNAPNITPEIGITATPVIDPVAGVIYITAFTNENGTYYWRLHALNVATGAEMPGSPVQINGSYTGTGNGANTSLGLIDFSPIHQLSRSGLVLNNGNVDVAFSSFNDQEPCHGWLFAYNSTTLATVGTYMTTPNSGDGNIWQAGGGPAVDSSGNLFFATGNGDPQYNSTVVDLADSILKVNLGTSSGGQGMDLVDYFTPYNRLALAAGDVDVGSGGVILLPDQPGQYPHLLVGGGKEGTLYLVNRDNMGQLAPSGATSDTQIVQELIGDLPGGTNYGNGIYGTMAYFNGSIYIAAAGDSLRSIPLSNGLLNWSGSMATGNKVALRGSSPSISANGTANGIVWYADASAYTYSWVVGQDPPALTNGPAVLYAYNPSNLAAGPLYASNQVSTDAAGYAVKYAVPTVSNGKVYLGTDTEISVYGLRNTGQSTGSNGNASTKPISATPSLSLIASANPILASQAVTLTETGGTAPFTYAIVSGSGKLSVSGSSSSHSTVYTSSFKDNGTITVSVTDSSSPSKKATASVTVAP